jgi:uncharacterized phage protein gp47/JayE
MAFGIKSFNTIVSDMVAYITLHSSKITDFSPGSIMRSMLEGVGIALEDFYFATYVGFKNYLQNIQKYVFDFPRKEGQKATVNVVFSRTDTSSSATIPAGTEVQTATGLKFYTTTLVTINVGVTDSVATEVEAEIVGKDYNVGAGTINLISSAVPHVDTVTNAASAAGGIDQESDISYKARFQLYIEGLGRCNVAGLRAAALGVEGVTSAYVEEHFPPISDVNATMYIDDGSAGGASAALVQEIQDLIDGDGTEDNPGYRAAGVQIIVVAPTVILQNVTATIELLTDIDPANVDTQIKEAITFYMASLGVDQEIVREEIDYAIMNVHGVYNCEVTIPATDVAIGANQVGRVGTFSFTYIEV